MLLLLSVYVAAAVAAVGTPISGLRVSVEHGFGKVMMLWGYGGFKMGLKIGISSVAACFMASILLCNMHSCLNGNQTNKTFGCILPSIEMHLAAGRAAYLLTPSPCLLAAS